MKISGVLTPIPTPFDDQDEVDIPRLRAALAGWLRTPLAGFVILGSNGEAAFLDEDESDRVIAIARDLVPKDRAFIAGTGRETTRGAVGATRRAAALGADAVLVRTPGFFKAQMTTDVFVRHFRAVADASPVPVLLYNYTAVTGVSLPVDAVARLAEHPNIAGMKESNGDLLRIADLVASTPDTFTLLAGSAATFFEASGRRDPRARIGAARSVRPAVRADDRRPPRRSARAAAAARADREAARVDLRRPGTQGGAEADRMRRRPAAAAARSAGRGGSLRAGGGAGAVHGGSAGLAERDDTRAALSLG
jgi:dihydrodipicolinate synthase/N-acetylneuraminate lyase